MGSKCWELGAGRVGNGALASLVAALSVYALALMMSTNSGFSDAPPTRNPSTSFWDASSLQVPPVTEPSESEGIYYAAL